MTNTSLDLARIIEGAELLAVSLSESPNILTARELQSVLWMFETVLPVILERATALHQEVHHA